MRKDVGICILVFCEYVADVHVVGGLMVIMFQYLLLGNS